jgi:hypothetical protein
MAGQRRLSPGTFYISAQSSILQRGELCPKLQRICSYFTDSNKIRLSWRRAYGTIIWYFGLLCKWLDTKYQCEGVEVNKNQSIEMENDQELARRKKNKLRRHLKARRFWDRLAGFIIVTVLVVGCGLLGLEYIILKGPSPALRDLFISTWTRRGASVSCRRSS